MSRLIQMTIHNILHHQAEVLNLDNVLVFNSLEALHDQLKRENYKLNLQESVLLDDLYTKVCKELKVNKKYDFLSLRH